jgi:hypothetical protein
MSAVITKKQKNTIMVLGGIAAVFGTVAGASGLLLREKYLVYDQNWDVDIISGFTEGYFGVMSGFIVSSLSIHEKKINTEDNGRSLAICYHWLSLLLFSYCYLELWAMVLSSQERRVW